MDEFYEDPTDDAALELPVSEDENPADAELLKAIDSEIAELE